MQTDILIQSFLDGVYDERLLDVYADETRIYYQRERYINAIKKFEQCYKPGDVEIFSAPGRTEKHYGQGHKRQTEKRGLLTTSKG